MGSAWAAPEPGYPCVGASLANILSGQHGDACCVAKRIKDLETYVHLDSDRLPGQAPQLMLGGIPPEIRWQVWKKAALARCTECRIGHSYAEISHAQNQWTQQIEGDICRTFSELPVFDRWQQQRLLRVLNAYAAYNSEVGYCQGMNFVAGLLLLISESEEEAFDVLVYLMEGYDLKGFYAKSFPLLEQYVQCCDDLMTVATPQLKRHFEDQGIVPAMYLHEWLLTLFVRSLPLSTVLVVWDAIMDQGLSVVIPVAVSILQTYESSLLSMPFDKIFEFFSVARSYEGDEQYLSITDTRTLMEKVERLDTRNKNTSDAKVQVDCHKQSMLNLASVPQQQAKHEALEEPKSDGGVESYPATCNRCEEAMQDADKACARSVWGAQVDALQISGLARIPLSGMEMDLKKE